MISRFLLFLWIWLGAFAQLPSVGAAVSAPIRIAAQAETTAPLLPIEPQKPKKQRFVKRKKQHPNAAPTPVLSDLWLWISDGRNRTILLIIWLAMVVIGLGLMIGGWLAPMPILVGIGLMVIVALPVGLVGALIVAALAYLVSELWYLLGLRFY